MIYLYEGGNVFGDGDIPKEYVKGIIAHVQKDLPNDIKAIPDIGSAGYKVASGDMDLFLDLDAISARFGATDEKTAKQALGQFMQAKGYPVKLSGRNVHIEVPYKTPDGVRKAQVDLMVIKDATRVAPWHQHGPRGSYDDPSFKAAHAYILMNSIGKALGLKVDAFSGTVMKREDNTVVADNRDDAAKILLNPNATGNDLNSVAAIMKALENDPNKEAKLVQARQDAAKGIITLPESIQVGSANWFRKFM